MTYILKPEEIFSAVELLNQGELVAIPTETVYGLAATLFHEDAIQKIFQVKGRPQDNPLIIHISSRNQLETIVRYNSDAERLMQSFWPGPLTIILPKKECVSLSVSAGLETVGVRMPAHPLALQLITSVGAPIVAPSANLSGKPSSTCVEHVMHDFNGKIAAVLDGGRCTYGLESTVLYLCEKPVILRPGSLTQAELEEVLGQRITSASGHVEKPLSPGMKYRHYAPCAKLFLFDSERDLETHLNKTSFKNTVIVRNLTAQTLYAILRKADLDNREAICVLCDSMMLEDVALMNRLERACAS